MGASNNVKMKIEHHVCSLDLSKKLKELGVKQESIFVWEYFNDKCHECYLVKFINGSVQEKSNNENIYSAFTVLELLDMLNKKIYSDGQLIHYKFNIKCEINEWHITYEDIDYITFDSSMANALAKMIIYMKKCTFFRDRFYLNKDLNDKI